MKPTIVLITEGKRESVDYATIRLFSTLSEAQDFSHNTSTGRIKYWTNAEILQDGEKVDLCQPQED